MLRPGGSSLSLRAIGSSLRNLNNISSDRLDERIVLLMPTVINQTRKSHDYSTNNYLSTSFGTNKKILISSAPNINKIETLNEMSSVNNESLDQSHGDQMRPSSQSQHVSAADKNLDVGSDQVEVYFKRWLILAVFCLVTLLSAFNWIEYGIIQDVVIAFYNESLPSDEKQQAEAANWFSLVYMLCYIPLVFPAMFLLERKGLRLSCILGALLTAIGAGIKIAAVQPHLFWVAMLGQTMCAIAQAFTLGVPARLSALWFGPNEIGLATSIGVFGNQLGTAIGFVIPPLIVKKGSVESMQAQFYFLLVPVAGLCAIAFVLAILLVKDQPDKPPSIAQLEIRKTLSSEQNEESDFKLFKTSLISLFKNLNFCLILVSYGINTGIYYAIGTLLNQMLTVLYPNDQEKIGIIGLILVLSGLLGAVIAGVILDKTKKFKLITFLVYAFSFLAMVLFTFTLETNIWVIFATGFLLGFFMTGYLPVGFELAAEVTYPASEGTACGLLNTSAQVFGIGYTYAMGSIILAFDGKFGPLYANVFASASLLVGTIITGFVKSDLRRQKAYQEAYKPEVTNNVEIVIEPTCED